MSLVFWSLTLIVSAKYVTFVLRADNDREGGVMALAALLRRIMGDSAGRSVTLLLLGVFGASLFYGDSVITPAISVLSTVRACMLPHQALRNLVLPISVTDPC